MPCLGPTILPYVIPYELISLHFALHLNSLSYKVNFVKIDPRKHDMM